MVVENTIGLLKAEVPSSHPSPFLLDELANAVSTEPLAIPAKVGDRNSRGYHPSPLPPRGMKKLGWRPRSGEGVSNEPQSGKQEPICDVFRWRNFLDCSVCTDPAKGLTSRPRRTDHFCGDLACFLRRRRENKVIHGVASWFWH